MKKVYLIGPTHKSDGSYKIGISTNPNERLVAIQVSNPETLMILATMPGTEKEESEFHLRYQETNVSGEWFHLNETQVLNLVDEMSQIEEPEEFEPRSYLRQTISVAQLLGQEITRARRSRQYTQEELAERAGITRVTLRRVERGDLTVAIGTVLEVAGLVGIPLFGGSDRGGLEAIIAWSKDKLALLPERISYDKEPVNDDF